MAKAIHPIENPVIAFLYYFVASGVATIKLHLRRTLVQLVML